MPNKWYVEVYVGQEILHLGEPFIRKDDQTILSFLSTCLPDPSFTIVAEDNYHFLVSTDFDTFNNEDDVLRYAQSQLPILNGIMKIKFDRNIQRIKIGDVYHRDSNGYLTRTCMRATFIQSALFPLESSLQSANIHKPNVAEMLEMAKNNPLVAEALQYFATSHNWYSLEKIFDLIANYMGKAENNSKVPKGTFNTWTCGRNFGIQGPGKSFDFLQTAHSYYWSGFNARHSSVGSKQKAGVNPMSLNEAIEYITDIFIKWLQINP